MRVLQVTPQFQKDWRDVPDLVRSEASNISKYLLVNPVAPSLAAKKLQGIAPSAWRVRIGQYRLIYSFTKTTVILHRIRLRKDVYRSL
jgi:addiction module RelE/StbE family toxin